MVRGKYSIMHSKYTTNGVHYAASTIFTKPEPRCCAIVLGLHTHCRTSEIRETCRDM